MDSMIVFHQNGNGNNKPALTFRACDECRSKKVKCKPVGDTCEMCFKKQGKCTFEKAVLKRGPRPLDQRLGETIRFDTDKNINTSKPKSKISTQKTIKRNTLIKPYDYVKQDNGMNGKLNIRPKPCIEQQLFMARKDLNMNQHDLNGRIFIVKTDDFGCLNVSYDEVGNKFAHYYIIVKESGIPKYSPVAFTPLSNHLFYFLERDTCVEYPVLGYMSSQQIYITIVFFSSVFVQFPGLDTNDFIFQLTQPITTSLLFLLNCICAVACPYSSNTRARFDRSQFYHKALEIHYFNEEIEAHPNWNYGHLLLRSLKPKVPNKLQPITHLYHFLFERKRTVSTSAPREGENNLHPSQEENRTLLIQQQLDEVTGIMRDNISKAYDNLGIIEELDRNTEVITIESTELKESAKESRLATFMNEWKYRLIIGGIIIFILSCIIIGFTLYGTHHEFLTKKGK